METLINNYGRLIDKIRKDRNKSRQELCEDIMSVRNFQRFANGEVSVSHDKIIQLIDRLNLDYFTFNQMYKSTLEDEYNKIRKAFNLAVNWQFDEALLEFSKIDKDTIDSSYNKEMYDVVNILIKTNKKAESTESLSKKLEAAINFPSILDHKVINPAELRALFFLNSRYCFKRDRRIVDFFQKIIESEDFVDYGIFGDIISSIYANVAKGLYSLKQYEECIDACDKGINHCRSTHRLSGFSNLLGYKSMSLNKLERFSEAYENAALLYLELILENNPEKTRRFKEVIEAELNIDFEDLVTIKENTA